MTQPAKHTPGALHNGQPSLGQPCTCRILLRTGEPLESRIELCPKHAAAPAMHADWREIAAYLSYENQGGLLVIPGTNQCAGYILNFEGHGAFQPEGKVETPQGPTKEEIDAILAKAELDHAIKVGKRAICNVSTRLRLKQQGK